MPVLLLLIPLITPMLQDKKIQYALIFLAFYFIFFWKSPLTKASDLLSQVIVSDNDLKSLLNKTGKYFTQAWYLERAVKRDVSFQWLLNSNDAQDKAEAIYKAKGQFGIFPDAEDKIYNIFGGIQNKLSVGFVAHHFTTTYKIGMLEYLQSFMNNKEMVKLIDIVEKKPLA